MLLNKFYTLESKESQAGKLSASVSFNKSHPIFSGHFPGHPVVPGVCMIQILREIMELEAGARLRISTGDNLKFLAIINPEEHPLVQVTMTYNTDGSQYNANASLQHGTTTFFKFKGTFSKI